jgi:DNA-binding MarR family transcriptional regulator
MNTIEKLGTDKQSLMLETLLTELVERMNQKRTDLLGAFNVSELDVEIIQYIRDHDMKKMKDIGEYFQIKLSTLTSIVDKLEKHSLVKRKHSRDDRRVIYIQMADGGNQLLEQLADLSLSVSREVAGTLDSTAFNNLLKGLDLAVSSLRSGR